MPLTDLHVRYASLGTLVWAACGKDPGFTPEFLLNQLGRHASYTQADCDRLLLRVPLDLKRLKQDWLLAQAEARDLVRSLPPEEIGCLYLDSNGIPVTPNPASLPFSSLTRHTGTVRGAWPTVISGGAG